MYSFYMDYLALDVLRWRTSIMCRLCALGLANNSVKGCKNYKALTYLLLAVEIHSQFTRCDKADGRLSAVGRWDIILSR